MFLPQLFLWSLILPQQTQNFCCIHSEPFFWVPRERQRLQSNIFWRARWKILTKPEKQHLLRCQTVGALCASLAMSAHKTSLHISSTGSFSSPEETRPVDVCWTLVDEFGAASEACNVISRCPMYALMPSCMFYCQFTAPAQIIYSTNSWGTHLQEAISTSLTSRMLQEISVTEIVCWTGHHKLQTPFLNVSSESPLTGPLLSYV